MTTNETPIQIAQTEASSLSDFRKQIDEIDDQLVALIAKRQAVVAQVIKVKKQKNIPARIPARVEEVVQNVKRLARQKGADEELVEGVWRSMIDYFIRWEESHLE